MRLEKVNINKFKKSYSRDYLYRTIQNKIKTEKKVDKISLLKKQFKKELELLRESENERNKEIKNVLKTKKEENPKPSGVLKKNELSAYDVETNCLIREIYRYCLRSSNNSYYFNPNILDIIKYKDRLKLLQKFFSICYYKPRNALVFEVQKLDNYLMEKFNLYEFLI